MEDESPVPVYSCDVLCDRARAICDIAAQMDAAKTNAAKKVLQQVADALLLSMIPKSADLLKLVPKAADDRKEKPL